MGRDHTYMDEAFGGSDYDPYDSGTYTRGLVGVMMAFDPSMSPIFDVISESCATLGLTAKRADESVGSGIVLREIVELIEDAEFLIFDLTHERPNVYYELGYAHGVGNESVDILLIAESGTTLHFDIAPIRVWHYDSNEHLGQIIAEALPKMIAQSRSG